ncbi:MAG: acyltransferase family protein [Clostridia bacterium]|nr:acyltransferase family protein [Clostridia bacterium]
MSEYESVISAQPVLVKTKKPRNASFELLRIVAMLFIVSVHFYGFGGWQNVEGTANVFFMNLTRALFSPSVNIFVLISAYFMCSRDDMKIQWSKLGKLWLTVFFYSVLQYAVFTATGVYEFEVNALLKTLFPISLGKYWFVSAYFVMSIASPFLNAIIKRLSKAQFSALFIAIVALAALQDAGVMADNFPLNYGYNGIWFCLLYFLAAYIRKYDINLGTVAWVIGLIVFAGVTLVITFVWHWADYTSIVTVYMSVFIFLTAKKFSITSKPVSKIICAISPLAFGVYLIHMSPEMCGFMYENIFHSSQFIPSKYAYLIYLGFVFATFAACAIAEWMRMLCFKGIDRLAHRLLGEQIQALKAAWSGFIARIAERINQKEYPLIDLNNQ